MPFLSMANVLPLLLLGRYGFAFTNNCMVPSLGVRVARALPVSALVTAFLACALADLEDEDATCLDDFAIGITPLRLALCRY